MRFTLEKKLVLIFLLVVLLLSGAIGTVLTNAYRSELMDVRFKELSPCIDDVKYLISVGLLEYPNSNAMKSGMATLLENYNAVLLLLKPNGEILHEVTADGIMTDVGTKSDLDAGALEILSSGSQYTRSEYYDNATQTRMIALAAPVVSSATNDVICIIYLKSDMKKIDESYARIMSKLWLPVLSSVIIGIVLVSFLTFRVTMPLKEISTASREIAKGNFDNTIDIRSNDEIGDLAKSYNIMAKELAKSEKMKREFIANVTHELRSPITSINGFVQGMLDGTIAQEEYSHYLNIVSAETRRLNKLIQEMLDLSRIESGMFPLNNVPFDLNELIRRVILKFSQTLEEKHIDLEVNLPDEKTMVLADPDRIEQVLQNLFDNAVKFTPQGRHIGIYTETGADTVQVSVQDEGQGIDELDLPYIWDRFYTVDKARTSSKNGTGLGLPIVKKILEQHGQNIKVTSQPGQGSVFVFTLALYKNVKRETGI